MRRWLRVLRQDGPLVVAVDAQNNRVTFRCTEPLVPWERVSVDERNTQ